jgi:hypothetical protein
MQPTLLPHKGRLDRLPLSAARTRTSVIQPNQDAMLGLSQAVWAGD